MKLIDIVIEFRILVIRQRGCDAIRFFGIPMRLHQKLDDRVRSTGCEFSMARSKSDSIRFFSVTYFTVKIAQFSQAMHDTDQALQCGFQPTSCQFGFRMGCRNPNDGL